MVAFNILTAHAQLLSESEGYFAHFGGSGGSGGRIDYVQNLNSSGSGSLKELCEDSGIKIILFENGVDGTIDVPSRIEMTGDTTLWGRHRDGTAADIYLNPTNTSAVLRAQGPQASNLIIANLKGDANFGTNDNAPDFIGFQNGAELLWLHHVSYFGDGTDAQDGFLDVTTNAGAAPARHVTMSFCRCTDGSNVHLFRRGAIGSFHHNYWFSCTGRHPQLQQGATDGSGDHAQAHLWNNWVESWDSSGTEIRAADCDGYIENNIYDASGDTRAVFGGGNWFAAGNVLTGGAAIPANTTAFVPPYSYTLEDVSTPILAQSLRDKLISEAGWQAIFQEKQMITALYRISSNEVVKISLKDQTFSDRDPVFWGVLTDPTTPDGTEVRDLNTTPIGPLRVFGLAKIAEPGANNVRNATQAEIDTFGPAQIDDDNQQDANRAIELLTTHPQFRKLFVAMLDEVRERPEGRPNKDLTQIINDVAVRISKND